MRINDDEVKGNVDKASGTVKENLGRALGDPILGTSPSARGPVFRGLICYKVYDGLRNFQRHPTEPTTGHGELVWHYTSPTPLYPFFETKQNKPLDKPFVSLVSFYYKDFQYRFDVTVRKTE